MVALLHQPATGDFVMTGAGGARQLFRVRVLFLPGTRLFKSEGGVRGKRGVGT